MRPSAKPEQSNTLAATTCTTNNLASTHAHVFNGCTNFCSTCTRVSVTNYSELLLCVHSKHKCKAGKQVDETKINQIRPGQTRPYLVRRGAPHPVVEREPHPPRPLERHLSAVRRVRRRRRRHPLSHGWWKPTTREHIWSARRRPGPGFAAVSVGRGGRERRRGRGRKRRARRRRGPRRAISSKGQEQEQQQQHKPRQQQQSNNK